MDNVKTGLLIAETRKALGLTQKDLAERLHVSIQAVSKWERGLSFPDVLLLEPLAQLLDLSVSELLAGERNPQPQEQLVQDSLRISKEQLGGKIKKWRKLSIAAIALLALLLFSLGFFFLQGHTKLFPRHKTLISYSEQSTSAALSSQVTFNGDVALYDITYADGITGEILQLELWTTDGLVQTWPLAEASGADPTDWPRHETIALASGVDFGRDGSPDIFRWGAALHNGTWRGTLSDVPYLSAGFGTNILTGRTEVHPEYGVVLACYYLDTTMQGIWRTAPCLGAVERPEVPEGQATLLLRLRYTYE